MEGKKMALLKGKTRLSIDIDNPIYKDLSDYVNQENSRWTDPSNLTKGFVINDAVKNLVSINDKTSKELYDFCVRQARIHEDNAHQVNASQFSEGSNTDTHFFQDEELEIANQFRNLAHMYNHYSTFQPDTDSRIKDMKRINIKDGYVVFPKDWVILNWGNPNTSENVFVIEVVDLKNQYKMPHFIFFDESMKTVEAQKKMIFKKAAEAYPKFGEILKMEVEPIYGEEDERGIRKVLNYEEYMNAPKSLIFQIADAGNELIQNYPYNAKIFREKQ